MARGINVIIGIVAVIAAISIMTTSGGFLDYTDYNPGDADTQDETEDVVEELEGLDVDVSNPISGLNTAYNLASTMFSLAWNVDTLMINLGVPEWVATPLSWLLYFLLTVAMINLLLRSPVW